MGGPSKTNQSRWEWHHNTFIPSLHHVPFCQEVERFTFLIVLECSPCQTSVQQKCSSLAVATTVSCTVFLQHPATRVRTVASDQIAELWIVIGSYGCTVATGRCKNLPGKTSGQVFKTVRQTGLVTIEPNWLKKHVWGLIDARGSSRICSILFLQYSLRYKCFLKWPYNWF